MPPPFKLPKKRPPPNLPKATIDLVEAEVRNRLSAGQGMEETMEALRRQGADVPAHYVRDRMAEARAQGPIKGDRGYDKKYRRMELNYIIERGLANGDDWDVITQSLQKVYPNGNVAPLVEAAKQKHAQLIQQNSPPAVIDSGDGRSGGPMADEEPPVRGSTLDPSGPVQDLADMRNMTPEGLLDISRRAMDEARRRKKEEMAGIRGKAQSKVDWSQFDDLFQAWKERDAKPEVTEGTKTYPEENLDVPIEQPGLNGPVGRPQ